MKKLSLFILLSIFAFCSLAYADYPARTKIYFTIHVPITVKAGEVIVPPGDYAIRDLGIAPNAILALSERGKSQPLAILYTVRIDRRLVDWTDRPRVVFDEEGGMPVMKKIFITSEDGYEIIGAVGEKEYKARGVVHVTKTETTTTVEKVETPAAAPPEPAPAPSVEPAPEPQVESAPAPQKEEPVAPVKERKRVRKE